jgi:hypothetical protein
VPWRRLIKEWAIYAGIMAVILTVFFRDGGRLLPILGGLVVSGPLYLILGAVLAKFGYQRKTLAEMRTPRAEPRGSSSSSSGDSAGRPKPAPTRRTSTGPSNRPRSKRR